VKEVHINPLNLSWSSVYSPQFQYSSKQPSNSQNRLYYNCLPVWSGFDTGFGGRGKEAFRKERVRCPQYSSCKDGVGAAGVNGEEKSALGVAINRNLAN
jgi:hypothetical protein